MNPVFSPPADFPACACKDRFRIIVINNRQNIFFPLLHQICIVFLMFWSRFYFSARLLGARPAGFLFPALISKLVPKFNKELKKGAVIISHGFPVSEYKFKLIKKVERSPFPTYYYKI